MLYPLVFQPLFKERVWGGRKLEQLFAKDLPAGRRIGESWEISDRPGDVSVIRNGPLAGKDLRWLMEHHQHDLLGGARDQQGRFPLLIKILDAQQTLSLQVHPSPEQAAALGGEPKTEMWYVVDAEPEAAFYAGLRAGTTSDEFERRLREGTVEECLHRLESHKGDSLFLPSGRLHAIAAGNVIFEIQQNSDTTYRVFDWNRVGLDGRPRDLHIEASLRSIRFDDIEPRMTDHAFVEDGTTRCRVLAEDPLFNVALRQLRGAGTHSFDSGRMAIVAQVQGTASIRGAGECVSLSPGTFCLVPAGVADARLESEAGCEFLVACAG